MTDVRAIVDRYVAALTAGDAAAAAALVSEDVVEEYPQSGEVIRGRDNFRAVLEHIPRSEEAQPEVDASSVAVVGADDRWVLTPTFTPIRIEGVGDRYTVVFRLRYADRSEWYVISLVQVRGDEVARLTTFFGPTFPPAEWRAPYVEVRPDR